MDNSLLLMVAGFAMGFFGSIPPTGPVALMVINRAFRGRLKFAFAAGVGGALAEVIYSALAVTGVGLVLQELHVAQTLIRALSTLVLLAVGVYFLVSPIERGDVDEHAADEEQSLTSALGHLGKGFSVAIVNPTLILNWTVAVAFFFSLFHIHASVLGRVLFVVGVGTGMIVWTGVEVWLLHKFQQRYSIDLLGRIQRWVSILVILAAAYLGYKTIVNW